jgi:hypothetical protein
VTNEEFKNRLTKFRYYMKPALFTVLAENAQVFSEETKKEIIEKLEEAESQVKELYEYQEKRNGILRKGLQKIEDVYSNVKARFQIAAKVEEATESAQADQFISNL